MIKENENLVISKECGKYICTNKSTGRVIASGLDRIYPFSYDIAKVELKNDSWYITKTGKDIKILDKFKNGKIALSKIPAQYFLNKNFLKDVEYSILILTRKDAKRRAELSAEFKAIYNQVLSDELGISKDNEI